MKEYSAYRDSGISWIGEIPEHWRTNRIKFMLKRSFAGLWGSDAKENENDVICFRVADFDYERGCLKFENLTKRNFEPQQLKERLLSLGDLLIEKSGGGDVMPVGRVVRVNTSSKSTYSNFIHSITLKDNFSSDFLYYYINQLYTKRVNLLFFNQTTGIQNLRVAEYLSQNIFLPPYTEQQTIVEYLNKKVSEIDDFISKQEEQIELLREWKQAEVSRVVSKGLNPEVKMKDSGIGWIGEIPEHWKMRKIKYVFTERSEKGYPEEPVLCSTQKYGVIPQSMYKNRVVVVNKGLEGLKLVKEGDFVISLRSFQGGIEYAYYRGIISAAYTILKLNNTLNEGYIKYLVKSFYFVELLKTCVTGIREGQNINYSSLRKHSIPIPPPSEQQEIVEYIERKTTEVDKLIVELTYQVEYLKEYKQRLISDVVTGKINVQPE